MRRTEVIKRFSGIIKENKKKKTTQPLFEMMMEHEETKGMTGSEEKELRRVFDYVSNYLPKRDIYADLNPRAERRAKILAHKKSPDAIKILDADGNVMTENEIEEEFQRLSSECERLQRQITDYDTNPNKKIHPPDLHEVLNALGKRASKVWPHSGISMPNKSISERS
jgi:hypothetical protein